MSKERIGILVIEDNPADADLVKIQIKNLKQKIDVYHVETLYEAEEVIDTKVINLVLLDLTLPDIAGFKTLTAFQQKYPKHPVIVLTGMNDEIVGDQAVRSGAQDFLVKGQFEEILLGRAIRYALRRHKTQMQLEETARNLAISEKRFIEAQQMTHFGNWEVDLVSNEMKWTDEVYRIFGFNPNSFNPTVSDYLSYVHIEEKEAVQTFFNNAGKDGNLHKLEHRIVINGHNIKYVLAHAKAHYDTITEKVLLVGGVQDITERKLSEKLLLEKNMSTQSSKIKEEVLENMGFHIRTPLSSIANLSFLLENSNPTKQQTEHLDGLKESIEELEVSVNNLMNFSVLVAEKVKLNQNEFSIADMVKSLSKAFMVKADNKGVFFDYEMAEEFNQKFVGDYNKVYQLLYNLLDNAIKFTDKNGKVSFRIFNKNQQGENIELGFSIEDTGVGMSRDKIKEILNSEDIFKQDMSEEDGEQRKYGIAIVKKLIETMGGSLDVSSELTNGSTFDVVLPLKIIKSVDRTVIGNEPNGPLKILLVEDHFLNQIATKKVLTQWSSYVTVDIAENGLVGFEKFRAHGYDVVLMDIQMPVMNGFEASAKIRETSEVPIIALTANASNQEAEKCYGIGMNSYLSKPFKPQELYDKILEILINEKSAI